uniref:Small ribosomal subunit protein RACK1 n=1 Tax=Steinernema glaseri TaxID=37863 RepID=A0A1I8A374_9BILA
MAFKLDLESKLEGHGGWVTQVTPNPGRLNEIVTASRDKSLIVWRLTEDRNQYGELKHTMVKRLTGHGHFVTDVSVSLDGIHAVSSSWDKTVRLWNLERGTCLNVFQGHTKDVLSVTFSPKNFQIISTSRDQTIKVWNALGICKIKSVGDLQTKHNDWVSCVRCMPDETTNGLQVITCGWDCRIKTWKLTSVNHQPMLDEHTGHTGYINTVAVSPDGSLCASGGRDGSVQLWDLERGTHLAEMVAGNVISQMAFAPNRYWLCAAVGTSVIVWNLENKEKIDEIKVDGEEGKAAPQAISLAWMPDGQRLIVGYTDGVSRIFRVMIAG